MHFPSYLPIRLLILILNIGFIHLSNAIVDLDSDGMSDVWERKYNAENAAPDIDYDKDGMSTLDESVAGTDPFDANSILRLRANQSNFSFSSESSNNEGKIAVFDDLPEVAESIISEFDTDGDGITDFEELW